MDDPSASGQGFNTLAGYLFGRNSRDESMAMTTPVAIDCESPAYLGGSSATGASSFSVDGGGGKSTRRSMSFVLPEGMAAAAAPAPVAGAAVSLGDVAQGERWAVAEFTGFVTDGEVRRQVEALRAALRRDARGADESGRYRVMQYNPPYTLPFRRRNEVAIRLVEPQ
ncbi:unnamed protein product [Phaeothamnion confervicola]